MYVSKTLFKKTYGTYNYVGTHIRIENYNTLAVYQNISFDSLQLLASYIVILFIELFWLQILFVIESFCLQMYTYIKMVCNEASNDSMTISITSA